MWMPYRESDYLPPTSDLYPWPALAGVDALATVTAMGALNVHTRARHKSDSLRPFLAARWHDVNRRGAGSARRPADTEATIDQTDTLALHRAGIPADPFASLIEHELHVHLPQRRPVDNTST